MRKITDERLKLRNLQHIRIAYIIQTFGILAILGYELFQSGMDGMRQNPVWLVFMVTAIVYMYLSMSTSVEHERKISNPKKSLMISFITVFIIASAIAFFVSVTPGFDWGTGLLVGLIIIVCGVIPSFYIYRLRMKQLAEMDE
ncbi:hypothetical protein ACTHOQ_01035 [Solibacillus silvestris]|uniref:hypothetical protein n=1 Tax=Solibacillus silvestris TaxID=76853 RepID=UPI003F80229B